MIRPKIYESAIFPSPYGELTSLVSNSAQIGVLRTVIQGRQLQLVMGRVRPGEEGHGPITARLERRHRSYNRRLHLQRLGERRHHRLFTCRYTCLLIWLQVFLLRPTATLLLKQVCEQSPVYLEAPVIVDQPHFPEAVHEMTYPGSRGAHHFG